MQQAWWIVGVLAVAVLGWWTLQGASFVQDAPVLLDARGVVAPRPEQLIYDQVPQVPARIARGLARYRAEPTYLFGWDPGGAGVLVSQVAGGAVELFRVEAPGAPPSRLTAFASPVFQAAISPDPARPVLLTLRDLNGDERYRLVALDLATGESAPVGDGRAQHGAPVWTHAGDRFAFYSDRRNGRDWDVLLAAPGRPSQTTPLVEDAGLWVPLAWSPDDRLLLLNNLATPRHPYWFHDTASGLRFPLSPQTSFIHGGPAAWGADGAGVYFVGSLTGDFQQLMYFELASGAITPLTEEIPWDVARFAVSPRGDRLALVVNEAGLSRLYTLSLAARALAPLATLPPGQIRQLAFDPGGGRLALDWGSASAPSDVYVIDLDAGAFEPVRWTAGHPQLAGLPRSAPRLIHYPTFDAVAGAPGGAPRQIPAFYFRPPAAGPHPALVYLHGGPAAQFVPEYDALFQYLAGELGVAVLAPNVRGSSGYGWRYTQLDDTVRRADALKDVSALLDWIAQQPELDAGRVAVMGESYGGFAALASLAFYGDRLRAGVSTAGIGNLIGFLEGHGGWGQQLFRAEFGDPDHPVHRAFLENISPLSHVERIVRPAFILQGFNDPRVPADEARQIVDALRAQGDEVWFLLALDEGHTLRRPANRAAAEAAIALFLETHLLTP